MSGLEFGPQHPTCAGDNTGFIGPRSVRAAISPFSDAPHHVAPTPACRGLEIDVPTLYVEGKTYQEIGDHLDRLVKWINDALQCIKRKLEVDLTDRATADHHEELALVA